MLSSRDAESHVHRRGGCSTEPLVCSYSRCTPSRKPQRNAAQKNLNAPNRRCRSTHHLLVIVVGLPVVATVAPATSARS